MSEEASSRSGSVATPRVSVVTTTYNGAAYLRETMDSMLQQTLRDFEYILIDDCSTDGTVALIQSYDDARIVLVQNKPNRGISESRNIGFRMARGTCIATIDQDDISDPRRLEKQVRHLEEHPDVSVVASRVHLLVNGVRKPDPMPVQPHHLLIHFALFFGRHNTTYSSLCLRRQFVVDHDLYFNSRFHYAEDYELFSRIADCGRFAILPEPLVAYRLHAQANSRVHSEEMAANGMTFMKACYARQLGRPVSDEEGHRIWNGLVTKQPPESLEGLRELGRLMTEFTAAFIARHAEGPQQAQQLHVLASQLWHEIVDRSVRSLGLKAERVRSEFDLLRAWSPTPMARLRTAVRGAMIGRRE